jgi:hypothetical protein
MKILAQHTNFHWFFSVAISIVLICNVLSQVEFVSDVVGHRQHKSMTVQSGPPDTIPVVIHVLHTGTPVGAPDNPEDSLIFELLGLMNAAFQKDGPFYGGADINLAFKLAGRSPECLTTTGLNRVDASTIPNYTTGGITYDTVFFPNSAYEVPVKGLSLWPNTDYLNIWIVNMTDGSPYFPGGYAYFPEHNSALIDGLVLQASVVNGTNKTVINELGHYLALDHTFGFAWEDCIEEIDCAIEGDLICDTENCVYLTDCGTSCNPCTEAPWVIVDAEFDYTVLNNYMGYTDCAWMFTEGQKAKIIGSLHSFRPGLLSSGALNGSADASLAEACIPSAVNGLSPFY